MSICTGTFISPTAVITAAHCIDTSTNGGVYIVPGNELNFSRNPLTGGTKALRAFTLGTAGSTSGTTELSKVPRDTAIVLFPPGIAKTYSAIIAARPNVGTNLTSIGYGLTHYYDDADPQADFNAAKHYGSIGTLADSDQEKIFVGDYTATESESVLGAKIVNSMGDSGGPIMHQNQIVGTLSVGGARDRSADGAKAYFSVYVDINSASTKELIALANANGAAIPEPGSTLASVETNSSLANSDQNHTSECN